MEKIPNNSEKIAKQINDLEYAGVSAVADDGSVCVSVKGSKARTWDIAQGIASHPEINKVYIGDGIQLGDIFFNNDEENIHAELSEVLNLF